MSAETDAADRDAVRVPVRRLTVLYDAECGLCRALSAWLARQPQLVPLDLVPAASDAARALFPGLDHGLTLAEVTVVGDSGQLYRGADAWVVVLWALREHRALAHRLSTPSGARLARTALLTVARVREAGWGGDAYTRGDGWAYDPAHGWEYACDSGSCPTD
ncbi:thiol-disulfide oxidoreductase DCC family protein [Streptomyces sp. 4F14]|uniref:thiol-disulfide oxidoreductase DCC family protein n=1 Tax=Streptomyces sp. 4F14 TaxID=3394380 RepID=UPI003A83DB72